MSNSAVGKLYTQIIDQVVETSRADFEENGVNTRMIHTFQETWQDHLSKRHTAHFPWEPAPAPAPEVSEPQSSTSRTAPAPTNRVDAAASSPTQVNADNNGPRVKQEPGQGNDAPSMSMAPATGFANAQDRAAHLSQQYQSRMSNTQYNPISLPGQQAQGGFGGMQYTNQQQMYSPQQQQQQRMPQQQWGQQAQRDVKPQFPQNQPYADVKQSSPQIKQEQRPEGIGMGQTDGAGDEPDVRAQWSAIVAHNRELKADGEKTRQADRMFKRQVAEQMQSMQGGGLLTPADEHRAGKQPQTGPRSTVSRSAGKSKVGANTVPVTPSRFDGGDDDDDEDKDAINSDLDDPEDDADDDNIGEEYEGDTIICLYDKVQRVKNKWKCTLKDGVVNADGKDYVFHKANGEFEW